MTKSLMFVLGLAVVAACGKGADKAGDKGAEPAKEGKVAAPNEAKSAIAAESAVYRPIFTTKGGDQSAGTAFVAKFAAGGPSYLVTAHHLFGEDGGLEREYASSELPGFVSKVSATSIEKQPALTAGAAIEIKGAKKYGQHPFTDMAVFPVTAPANAPALVFATTKPAEGAPVWLIAPADGSPTVRHAGKVVQADDEGIGFAFENGSIQLRGTSGGPIVNEAGNVVGIFAASGNMDGKTIGFGTPAWTATKLAADSGVK
jgi:S1-C subfamily serine protease